MCEEYNGYKNRETFDVITWLDNEELSQNLMKEWAEELLEDNPADERGDLSSAYYEMSTRVKDYFNELNDYDNLTRETFLMLMDIGSLYRVSWREIGERYIDQVIEDSRFSNA